jgi:hypothetical protein
MIEFVGAKHFLPFFITDSDNTTTRAKYFLLLQITT